MKTILTIAVLLTLSACGAGSSQSGSMPEVPQKCAELLQQCRFNEFDGCKQIKQIKQSAEQAQQDELAFTALSCSRFI